MAIGDDRERVREASDIVEVIGSCVSLRPKGREFVGLCPFHEDHTPSMSVVPAKQIFHCFSCGAGGDVFTFVQRFHSMEFPEALRFLAERAGIELSRSGPRGERAGSRRRIIEANAMARDFFRSILRHAEHGEAARNVLDRRGISRDMIERFELGAAPRRWDGLMLVARERGVDESLLLEAGVLKRRERGVGDTFRHRVVFPIHDQIGRVIAFGARRIDDEDEPKYLNSPESAVFNKSATLYGLHQAARAIQRERLAIVTEGYTDVIACHQAGVEHVVATLGTALTRAHARTLRRLCDRVVLLFDSDDAGAKAADRAAEVFFSEPIDVAVATLAGTGAKDPDELLRAPDGRDLFLEAIGTARDLLEFRYDRLRERLSGQGISAQQRALEEEVRRLGELGLAQASPTRREFVIRRLSEVLGLPTKAVIAALRHAPRKADQPADLRDDAGGTPSGPSSAGAPRPVDITARDPLCVALGCLLGDPTLLRADRLDAGAYPHPLMRRIAGTIEDMVRRQEPSLEDVIAALGDDAATGVAVGLFRLSERLCEQNPERRRRLYADCLQAWRRRERAGAVGGAIERLHRVREMHERLGGNPQALPTRGEAGR